jgi:hypothetical protein
MNKQINITLILPITSIGSVQSSTSSGDEKIAPNLSQTKDYELPIKRWAGDAQYKLKRFFDSNYSI